MRPWHLTMIHPASRRTHCITLLQWPPPTPRSFISVDSSWLRDFFPGKFHLDLVCRDYSSLNLFLVSWTFQYSACLMQNAVRDNDVAETGGESGDGRRQRRVVRRVCSSERGLARRLSGRLVFAHRGRQQTLHCRQSISFTMKLMTTISYQVHRLNTLHWMSPAVSLMYR